MPYGWNNSIHGAPTTMSTRSTRGKKRGNMKQSAGLRVLLAVLATATSTSASARAGARASTSSGGILHNAGAAKDMAMPRLDVAAAAAIEEPLLTPAGEVATALVGGEAVPEVGLASGRLHFQEVVLRCSRKNSYVSS